MESRGGGCDRALLAGEDGLIALAVAGVIGAFDVGWERDVAQAFEGGPKVAWSVEADSALAQFAVGDDLAFQVFVEANTFANSHLPAGTHQRLPVAAVGGDAVQQKDFDVASVSGACAEQAGRKDARVVQHEAIAGAEEAGEVAECAIFPAAFAA